MSSSNRSRNRFSSGRNYSHSSQSTSSAASNNPAPRPATNAWARPLQQNRIQNSMSRPSSQARKSAPVISNPPPGLSRSVNSGSSVSSSTSLQNNLRDRFLLLNQSLVGQLVSVSLTSGDTLEAIFHTFTPFRHGENKNKYVFKSCKFTKSTEERKDGTTLILNCDEVKYVTIKSVRLEGGGPKVGVDGSLVTDTDISSRGSNINGSHDSHGLVAAGSAWMSGGAPANSLTFLASRADALKSGNTSGVTSTGLKGNIGQWDQFSENEKLFNVKGSYDEEVYTTSLDRKSLDASQIERAEKMAKEIEGSSTANIHIAEERGHKIEGDFDEEDLYSGVIRNGANKVWGKKGALVEAEKNKSEEESKNKVTPPPIKKNYAAVAAAAATPFTSGAMKATAPQTKSSTLSPEATSRVSNEPSKTDTTTNTDKALSTSTIAEVPKKDDSADENITPVKSTSDSALDNEKEVDTTVELSEGTSSNDGKTSSVEEPSSTKSETTAEVPLTETKSADEKEKEDKKSEEKPKKVASKLNANAKSFSFNPAAKSFTPGAAATQQPAVTQQHAEDPYSIGMVGYAPHPQHYIAQQHMQPGMIPMMSGQMGAGGLRYPAPGPYAPYPMPQHPISQMPTQPPQQSTQDPAPGYDGATSTTTTSSTESAPSAAGERPQPSSAATQNVQQHPYGMTGYYPSPGTHQTQTAMMHRASPHMGGGYPSHHNMPQQFPMPGAGSAPHYGTMYQSHMPQHAMPSAAHATQPMHPNVYYNPMNVPGGTPGVGGMHGYPTSYTNIGGGHGIGDDGDHSFRGGRGRGGGGRGRKGGRKGGRGGNTGRGSGYHQSNMPQVAQQQHSIASMNDGSIKQEKENDSEELNGRMEPMNNTKIETAK